MLFKETRIFTARVGEFLDDEGVRALQNALQLNPELGAVMPGCSGLRKVRWSLPGHARGKRGGCRVIYLNLSEYQRIDLVTIYGKSEQDNLTEEQKRILGALAELAREEARALHLRQRKAEHK